MLCRSVAPLQQARWVCSCTRIQSISRRVLSMNPHIVHFVCEPAHRVFQMDEQFHLYTLPTYEESTYIWGHIQQSHELVFPQTVILKLRSHLVAVGRTAATVLRALEPIIEIMHLKIQFETLLWWCLFGHQFLNSREKSLGLILVSCAWEWCCCQEIDQGRSQKFWPPGSASLDDGVD